jgi:antirestriction protein ArdC
VNKNKKEITFMTIDETITARILKQLEAGTVPWRKIWKVGLPKSLVTREEYGDVNSLVLGSTEFTSQYWLTYHDARRLGGHVRKGERSSPLVYWQWRTAEELKRLADETGQEDQAPCVPYVSPVFNLDQVVGVGTPPQDDLRHKNRLQVAECLFEIMPDKPEIVHTVTAQPAYSPRLDRVTMPHLSQFNSADHFFCTLYHELTHATGHPKRLNRFSETAGDQFGKHSFEALVAEFGAAFLCGFSGIQNSETESLQASYIQGWAQVFRQDSRLLVRAASAAQRATDYIRGKVIKEETNAHAQQAGAAEVQHA